MPICVVVTPDDPVQLVVVVVSSSWSESPSLGQFRVIVVLLAKELTPPWLALAVCATT